MEKHDRFLKPKEVAECLSLSLSTVYFYAQTGQLPAVQIGKRWRIPADRLERWLENKLARQRKGVIHA